jgi:hypothetical protein
MSKHTVILKANTVQACVVKHACNPNTKEAKSRGSLSFRPAWSAWLDSVSKRQKQKAGDTEQVVEHLPTMHKALAPVPQKEVTDFSMFLPIIKG